MNNLVKPHFGKKKSKFEFEISINDIEINRNEFFMKNSSFSIFVQGKTSTKNLTSKIHFFSLSETAKIPIKEKISFVSTIYYELSGNNQAYNSNSKKVEKTSPPRFLEKERILILRQTILLKNEGMVYQDLGICKIKLHEIALDQLLRPNANRNYIFEFTDYNFKAIAVAEIVATCAQQGKLLKYFAASEGNDKKIPTDLTNEVRQDLPSEKMNGFILGTQSDSSRDHHDFLTELDFLIQEPIAANRVPRHLSASSSLDVDLDSDGSNDPKMILDRVYKKFNTIMNYINLGNSNEFENDADMTLQSDENQEEINNRGFGVSCIPFQEGESKDSTITSAGALTAEYSDGYNGHMKQINHVMHSNSNDKSPRTLNTIRKYPYEKLNSSNDRQNTNGCVHKTEDRSMNLTDPTGGFVKKVNIGEYSFQNNQYSDISPKSDITLSTASKRFFTFKKSSDMFYRGDGRASMFLLTRSPSSQSSSHSDKEDHLLTMIQRVSLERDIVVKDRDDQSNKLSALSKDLHFIKSDIFFLKNQIRHLSASSHDVVAKMEFDESIRQRCERIRKEMHQVGDDSVLNIPITDPATVNHYMSVSLKSSSMFDIGTYSSIDAQINGAFSASKDSPRVPLSRHSLSNVTAMKFNGSLDSPTKFTLRKIKSSLKESNRQLSLVDMKKKLIAENSNATPEDICLYPLVNTTFPIPHNLFDWNFNVLDINDGLQLCNIVGKLFEQSLDLKAMKIDSSVLARFILEIAKNYHDRPFHNLQHATCVTHFSYMLIQATNATTYLNSFQIFGMLIAALVHDVDHPGNTNLFEVNSNSELAVRYNDQSVLENHHCSTAFKLMNQPKLRILANLSKPVASEVRRLIISCVMATDIAVHFDLIEGIKKRAVDGWDLNESKNQELLGKILVHASDLSNPVRPFDIARKWAERISVEFNDQVSKEKALGMPVLGFMMTPDEKTFCKNETGFASYVVAPMWRNIAILYPNLQFLVDQLDNNLLSYKAALEKLMEKDEKVAQNGSKEVVKEEGEELKVINPMSLGIASSSMTDGHDAHWTQSMIQSDAASLDPVDNYPFELNRSLSNVSSGNYLSTPHLSSTSTASIASIISIEDTPLAI